MAYQLKNLTIRANNTDEGIKKIQELWADIANGTLPLLFDSNHTFQPGISPVSQYCNYATDETGAYDLCIMGVTADFFPELERNVRDGFYKKYDVSDETGNLVQCSTNAWQQVWNEQRSGAITRAFTTDFESSVPAEYTKDGCAHCYLYIAIK